MVCCQGHALFFFFFFNDTATTEIYTLSLHDALPIWAERTVSSAPRASIRSWMPRSPRPDPKDRKSTRLNSSHLVISYAVFCLKKKKDCDSQQNYILIRHKLPHVSRDCST